MNETKDSASSGSKVHENSPFTGYRPQDGLVSPISGPDTLQLANEGMTAGGMRGIGLIALILAQIYLKLETVKLAKGYYEANKRDFEFFKSTHQPGAQASVAEAMSDTLNPKYVPDEYASSPAGLSKSKIIDMNWFGARRRTHRYATGAQERLDYDMAVLRAGSVCSGWNAGRRYEMAWADAHNERRFARKISMANLGIAVGNVVRQGLATAVVNVAEAQSGLSSTIGAIGNGYFKKEGYQDAQRQVRARHDSVTKG